MTARTSLAGFAGTILAVVAVSYVLQPEASRAGQLVFIQDAGRRESLTDDTVGSIAVVACRMTPEGLRVTGRVISDEDVAVVVVSPGAEGRAGRAVGRAEAVNSSRFAGAEPGDFQLVLEWASVASGFAVVDGDSLGPGAEPVRTGPSTRCPGSQ